jgi:hypothetical protein
MHPKWRWNRPLLSMHVLVTFLILAHILSQPYKPFGCVLKQTFHLERTNKLELQCYATYHTLEKVRHTHIMLWTCLGSMKSALDMFIANSITNFVIISLYLAQQCILAWQTINTKRSFQLYCTKNRFFSLVQISLKSMVFCEA